MVKKPTFRTGWLMLAKLKREVEATLSLNAKAYWWARVDYVTSRKVRLGIGNARLSM